MLRNRFLCFLLANLFLILSFAPIFSVEKFINEGNDVKLLQAHELLAELHKPREKISSPRDVVSETPLSYRPHAPIIINSDADFTPANGVTGGLGTSRSPYIIEGWEIDAHGRRRALYIGNTTAYFVVRNCYLHNITYWWRKPPYAAVELYNVENGLLENNICSNASCSILLWKSSRNTLTHNTCSISYSGIYLLSSSHNTFSYNNCSHTMRGIYIQSSSGNKLTYNICSDNKYGIYLDRCSGNTLASNDCSNNGLAGIYIFVSAGNTLAYNICSNNYDSWSGSGDGIYLLNSSGNTLTHNICSDNSYSGIFLQYSLNNTLICNTCSANTRGIILQGSSHNTLTYNICSNNQKFYTSRGDGIYLWRSSSNNLTYNICLDNHQHGISLGFSSHNTLTYNNITGSASYGIYAKSYSNFSFIHHNNFINNNRGGVQAYDENGRNFWNDTTGEGNYWSDYTTRYPDAHQIGNVWDIPYTLDGRGQDNYPLVNPIVIPTPEKGSGALELVLLFLLGVGLAILFFAIYRITRRKR